VGHIDSRRLAQYIGRNVSRDPDRTVNANTPLISSGLLDSLSLIRVLSFIEDEFEVAIPDEFVTSEGMDSVAKIVQLADTHGRFAPRRRLFENH
jgi:acyl carrier protein